MFYKYSPNQRKTCVSLFNNDMLLKDMISTNKPLKINLLSPCESKLQFLTHVQITQRG